MARILARLAWTASCALVALIAAGARANPLLGPDSGKPVPRFESLKYGEVNGRRGPDPEQQILWTYHRHGLPVRVVAESGAWRRIEDPHGDFSWVSAAMLEPHRAAFVAGDRQAVLRRGPHSGARPVALLEPGVVAQLRECHLGWRKLRIGQKEGWTEVAALWGADTCEGAD